MTQIKFSPNQKMVLRTAVAAALSVAAMGAQAVVNITAGTGVVKVASEIPSTTLALANAGSLLNIALTAQSGVAPTATDPYYVRINLQAGVTFATGDPTMTCSGVTGVGGASAPFSGNKQAGGLGFGYVTFAFTGDSGAGGPSAGAYLTGICTLTLNAAGLTLSAGVAGTNLVVTSRTEYKDGASYTTAFLSDRAYVTYVKGMTSTVSAASGVVVDATSGSNNFASAQSDLTSETVARLGRYVTTGAVASAVTATLVGNVAATDIYSGAQVTVSGDALAAGLAANGTSGVFLSTTATCSNVAYTVQSTANAGSTVTFTSVTTADISSATGVQVCMNVSGGTAQIATGAVYVGSLGVFAANVTANLGGMRLLSTVTSNGITRNAYLIHSPTSTSKTSLIWFKNTGLTAGPVYMTCYNAAGTVIGTPNATIFSSLAVNQISSKDSAGIMATSGGINYTSFTPSDKFSCIVNAALAGMQIINYSKDVSNGSLSLTQAQTD